MAAAQYFEQVQKIFIAFYQRPADPAGLKYWAERVDAAGGDINQVIDAFASSPEAIDLYGVIDETTIGDVIDQLYMALFNAAPDAAGKQFYVDAFAAGTFTAGTIALNVLNGAQNDDRVAINNKVQVANEFTQQVDGRPLADAYFGTGSAFNVTYDGDADAGAARGILAAVTSSPSTVVNPSQVTELLKSQIADATDPIQGQTGGQTFTLTTGADNFVGTAGNDTIIGVADGVTSGSVGAGQPVTQTFGGLDIIDGGAGTDTIRLTNEEGTMTLATSVTVKNVENLEMTSATNVVTADVQAWTGLQSVVANQKAAANTIITTKSNATSVSVKGGSAATITDSGTGNAATKDTLASVTVEKVAGLVAANSDALTTLNVIDNANDVTVTAAAGTRVLNLGLNKVTAGTITDGEATGLKIATTGANSSGIVLSAAKATTIEFSGDKTVSLDIGNAAAQAANLVITSSNSAGVTLATSALDTDVTFTGGAGKDSIIVGATTKTIDMGAGDDTVEVSVALGTNGKIVGGDGTDTLKMTAAVGQTLSATDAFAKTVEGFEKVSLGAVAAATDNTVNLANLDNIDYVVSAGTAAGGSFETAAIVFSSLAAGASVTIAGRTVTATSGSATDAQVATAFSTGTTAGMLTVSGTLAAWTAAAAAGNSVTFTSTTMGNVGNLAPTFAGVAAPTAPSVSTTNGVPLTSDETAEVTFTDLAIGQSVTVAGRVITAATGAATAAQVAAVAVSGTSTGTLTSANPLTGWTAGVAAGDKVTFTSSTSQTDVSNLVPTVAGTAVPTVASNTPVDGGAGASLTVTNMANNGTFELTNIIGGAATVTMKDATGSADSLNIRLNGTTNITNVGTLAIAGVETINIEATDSSVDTVTLTNPAAASKINLVAADATKIVVSGNHGIDFTGSTLTKVVELDASGVAATGATTGATAAQIGTAGAVTFTSAVTDKNVTVKTGNGADVINLSSVTDVTKGATVTTGEGNDTVTGTAGNDTIDTGAGRDTVNATAGADTITLGAGNDVYVLGLATNSTLAKSDTLVGFAANTKGQGTTPADIAKGSLIDATGLALTGDTIDVTAALAAAGGLSTGIAVFVAANAADAQTFLQNTGNAGTLTGFALDSTTGKLYMDFDSNGTVDSVITLTGVTTITEAAFVTAY